MKGLNHKDLLEMQQLSENDIDIILNTAESMKEISTREIKKVPTLRGKSVILFFQEPSTRTRTSFEMAARRLSADTVSISEKNSSIVKGETLNDTAKNLEAMNPDLIIIRHGCSGAAHLLAKEISAGVINAGDGIHEHPTQALLDLYTIRKKKGKIHGLKIAIVGDILHSRVARSDIVGLNKMGAEVTVSGPPTLMPVDIESMGARVIYNPEKAVQGCDVVIVLRMQLERQSGKMFPSLREYAAFFGINKRIIQNAKKDVIVMHPGPLNRGVEIEENVADGPYSVILEQVTNGVAVRMALLFLMVGGAISGDMD